MQQYHYILAFAAKLEGVLKGLLVEQDGKIAPSKVFEHSSLMPAGKHGGCVYSVRGATDRNLSTTVARPVLVRGNTFIQA